MFMIKLKSILKNIIFNICLYNRLKQKRKNIHKENNFYFFPLGVQQNIVIRTKEVKI